MLRKGAAHLNICRKRTYKRQIGAAHLNICRKRRYKRQIGAAHRNLLATNGFGALHLLNIIPINAYKY